MADYKKLIDAETWAFIERTNAFYPSDAVDQTIEVTVVIYSSSAVRIATLYNGIQPPGAYEVVWNGLTDNNTPAPKGDYVAEVQLGDQRVSRKRIVWPPTK